MNYLYLIIALLVFAGIVWLQIVLSNKKNKWLGLILPSVAVCFSILTISVTPAYVTRSAVTVEEHAVTQSGDVVENIITNIPQEGSPGPVSLIFTGIYLFLLYNIPTAILLVIYAICRSNRKNQLELEKMNIQDLS
jgi:hypothetical protein